MLTLIYLITNLKVYIEEYAQLHLSTVILRVSSDFGLDLEYIVGKELSSGC